MKKFIIAMFIPQHTTYYILHSKQSCNDGSDPSMKSSIIREGNNNTHTTTPPPPPQHSGLQVSKVVLTAFVAGCFIAIEERPGS